MQASDEELRQALAERRALCLDSRWRAVDPAYLGHVLELLLLTAAERGWAPDALDGAEAAAALQADGSVDPRWVSWRLHERSYWAEGLCLGLVWPLDCEGWWSRDFQWVEIQVKG